VAHVEVAKGVDVGALGPTWRADAAEVLGPTMRLDAGTIRARANV
jgi:hypothetical protein